MKMMNPSESNRYSWASALKKRKTGWLCLLTVFLLAMDSSLIAQVGVHTDVPDASSAMEIVASNKGLLIPRVTLTATLTNPSPVTSPAIGLLVFNIGANQPMGFYYWNGSTWVATAGSGGGTGAYWELDGNAGTNVASNYIGTTDAVDFAVRTNNLERMRVETDGQIVMGATAAANSIDVLAVYGNATQIRAINAYSPNTGLYADAASYGTYTRSSASGGYPLYAKNFNTAGYGAITVGSNDTARVLSGRSGGLSSLGDVGMLGWGRDNVGIGISAAGNYRSPVALADGAGGIFVGFWGSYARSHVASGTGVIGLGNNQATSYFMTNGSGGAFTGNDGIYGKSINNAGNGVIGFGNNIAGNPSSLGTGSGGAFTGNDGVYGKGVNSVTGTGVIGVGNNLGTPVTMPTGSGGAFVGYHGILSVAYDVATGTGVAGAGNNVAYLMLGTGSGGAFTGSGAGLLAIGIDPSSGNGVIGAGNNLGPYSHPTGSGGNFVGNDGVFSFGLNSAGTGVVGAGNGVQSLPMLSGGSGGAFFGVHGAYGRATTATGTGVIGAGNNTTPQFLPTTGSGGAFTGTAGAYGKSISATGTGIVGLGNNLASNPNVLPGGSGAAFTGSTTGSVSFATSATGTGIMGAGNGLTSFPSISGSGGLFVGTAVGMLSQATTAATGTGIIGLGNNLTSFTAYASGSGGLFYGLRCGVASYATQQNNASYGIYGSYTGGGAFDGVGLYGYSYPNNNYGYGVYGQGRRYGVFSNGAYGGSGAKYFVIDHPLDPENKILRHACIESPEVLNLYRGNVVLDDSGEAIIQLPDYFLAININFSYDLTAIGKPAPGLYILSEINDSGSFSIAGGTPGQKVSWVVYAERNDLYMQQDGPRDMELEKESYQRGKYIMPELYGRPQQDGIFFTEANLAGQNPATDAGSPVTATELEMTKVEYKAVDYRSGQTTILKQEPLIRTTIELQQGTLKETQLQTETIRDLEDGK